MKTERVLDGNLCRYKSDAKVVLKEKGITNPLKLNSRRRLTRSQRSTGLGMENYWNKWKHHAKEERPVREIVW